MTKKMTMRNTVTEIINYLADCAKAIGKLDKNLYQRMAYTSKALKKGEKVPKKDLLDLANDCFTVMAAADEAKPKKEASAKPAPKKSPAKKTPEKKEAKKAPAKKTEAKPVPKKSEAKKAPKKSEKAAPKSTPKKKAEKPKGFEFPKSFSDDDGAKYTLADDINTLELLREALADEEDLVVAAHWTSKDIVDGQYGAGQLPKKMIPKRFDNDLDLLTVLYAGETIDTFISVSMYTEASYYWTGKSLGTTTKSGGHKGVQLEYALYRVEEE